MLLECQLIWNIDEQICSIDIEFYLLRIFVNRLNFLDLFGQNQVVIVFDLIERGEGQDGLSVSSGMAHNNLLLFVDVVFCLHLKDTRILLG